MSAPDIETIVREIVTLKITSREEYFTRLKKIRKLWMEFEQNLPLYTEEEIRRVLRERIGKVNYERCLDVCRALARMERPARFTEIRESIRDSPEFAVVETSMNKVLSRTLKYLVSAGLVVKCSRITRSGREAETYYFRLFRLLKGRRRECERCEVLQKILEIAKGRLKNF